MSTTNIHGFRGKSSWPEPKLVAESDKPNRKDQGNFTLANEYLDSEDVLEEKMEIIAQLIRESKCTVAYTGAGLSKASGIPDYATKAVNSVVKAPKIKSSLDAQPTFAHFALCTLEKAGLLHHWVQQNHDGLPQKAGFPQDKINEIHGAWFDPSNPVVQFSGSLRSDLFKWMVQMERKTDLCLCLGTSLSGMNADRMANTPAEKSLQNPPQALGTVIINIQKTPLDDQCAIRVWGTLDQAFTILAKKLGLEILPAPLPIPSEDVFQVPYNAQGLKDDSCLMTWDLRLGAKVMIPVKGAMNEGVKGHIARKRDGHWSVELNEEEEACRRLMGSWWADAAVKGLVPQLPIVNINPVITVNPEKEYKTYNSNNNNGTKKKKKKPSQK